ncbi:hypothetical protein [Streptomyces sp. NPDC050485]|uniref:hypothetical protein n=1 Tax=Streptomyces sp. NPDC050485 TaxID=3365617 RepID=UPI00378C6B7C
MGELEPDSEVGAVRFSDEGTLEVFDGTAWGPYEPPEDNGLGTIYKGRTGVSPLPTRPQSNDPTEEPGS